MSRKSFQPRSRESALLLACLRHRLSHPDPQSVRDRILPGINWPSFIHLVKSHRVTSLVYAILANFPGAVPAAPLAQLRSAYHAAAVETLFLVSRLLQLIRLLEENNIPVIPFKGPILASEVYGDFALRAVGDLDLLIPQSDIVRARALLIEKGYTPVFPSRVPREQIYLQSLTGQRLDDYIRLHAEHHLASPDGRVALDLHWAVALREHALPLDPAELWHHARRIDLAGTKIRTLAMEDLFVVLCINGAKDSWPRLDRLCDVAALIQRVPDLDWPRILSLSSAASARRIVMVTLCLIRDLLDFPLPPAIRAIVDSDRAAARLAAQIRPRLSLPARDDLPGIDTFSQISFQLRLREHLRDRWRFLLAQLIPTVGDWAACPLPENLRLLHYLIRPLRLLVDRAGTP
jgi:hypothetical protein